MDEPITAGKRKRRNSKKDDSDEFPLPKSPNVCNSSELTSATQDIIYCATKKIYIFFFKVRCIATKYLLIKFPSILDAEPKEIRS